MSGNEFLLEIKNLKKYYSVEKGMVSSEKAKVKAVDNVSFSIKKGETFGLVGESGCGKSTLGRTIVRLIESTDGSIIFDGKDIAKMPKSKFKDYRGRIQIVFQDPSASLNPRRTISQILNEPYIVHKIFTKQERDKKIKELLDLVGLAEYHLSRYPHELSGGQKQRIGIARALALSPELIVCDEPVSALDVSIQAQIINLLEDLQKELSLTYLFISHNLNVVYEISDSVGVMYLGKLVEVSGYNELYRNPLHPYTKALMSAIPQAEVGSSRKKIVLDGDVPNPVNPPSGCRFHTRCNKCSDRCMNEEPVLTDAGEGHFIACHLHNS